MVNHETVLKVHAGVREPDTDLAQRATVQAGQDLWDERTAHLYQFTWRDVRHAGIVLPAKFSGDERMGWAQHRSLLWNLAEYSEVERDARVARGYTAHLPTSLKHVQRLDLARGFAQSLADRFGSAVDFAVHDPHRQDPRHHAHFLMTSRELTVEGFGRVASNGTQREVKELSRLWVGQLTQAVQAAFIEERLERVRSKVRSGRILAPQHETPQSDLRQSRGNDHSL